MAGFLAAAGLIGGAASAAGHGLADSHERAGDIGGADVIFQTATANNVFCLEHHCGFHFRRVADIARGGIERAHELEHADTEAGGINADVFDVVFFGEFADGFRLGGKVHAFPLVTLKYSEFATGHQALADALMLPLNAFNKLRSGIDWVLEKLGVINKESDTLDQTAARTHAATYGTGGYIPATSSYAGYQAYQPVTAPAGRSYVDQSKNEYHISLTGGTAPGTQLDRQLQDALEKYERDKRARARASMMHDG